MRDRNAVVNMARSWLGKNEKDGSFKEIIDIYNSFSPLPRGLKMQYNWAWCACTVSAIAIKLGYTDIIPIEISVGNMIKLAQQIGIWKENDDYVPSIGDFIVYDWDDNGKADCVGWPDHIGVVDYVNRSAGYIVADEGNYSNAVKRRTISINGKFIRGFITPKYDTLADPVPIPPKEDPKENKDVDSIAREVIVGKWGNGVQRKEAIEAAGYNYSEVQKKINEILNTPTIIVDQGVNKEKKVTATCAAKKFASNLNGQYVTTSDLYCRNDAGSNKKALCKIPKGTKVNCYGYYNLFNNVKWLYIQFNLNGILYTGFSSSNYLKKA